MLNLHSVVRNTITALHPDEAVTLFQSVGQTNTLGRVKPAYAAGVTVIAQIQTLSTDELQQREDVSKTGIDAKAYLLSDEDFPVAGIVRKAARNGDYIQRLDGTWWLVVSVIEDFSKSGWECVGLAQQLEAPDFSGSSWYDGGANG